MAALFEEIENDARSGGGLYDAYYTNPVILGTAAMLNGFMDFTPYVKTTPYADWTDVLLALRKYVTSFEERILMVLLDGDTHTLFYRRDVLDHFGLDPPRTWNEYIDVAKFVHGKEYSGIKLSGSCVSRRRGDHAQYWSHLVLSTITQTHGTSHGSLFDPTDMTPLTGAAVAEMLRIHNVAPYAANGGWGGAVSANTDPEKQRALADFLLWSSSREQSARYVIPNATLPISEINGQDPFRRSHLDVDKWVARGFDRDVSKQYVESIMSNLISKNVVVEMRFPKAGEIMSVLDVEVHDHLVRAHGGLIPDADREKERRGVAQRLTDQWNQIIKEYDERGDTVAPILEVYQRLRGVYYPNEQKNQLDRIRPLGLTLVSVILAFALSSAAWVGLMREKRVVKASQPLFLELICLGIILMASSIVPMGIDDSVASQHGCDVACMATPWLVAVGFSVSFAALFSKIWRLNRLMKSAMRFRKIQVTVGDVIRPFAVMLALNVVFLSVWTAVDPLRWERVDLGRTEAGELASYGRCASSGVTSWVMLGLIVGANVVALILANIQSYQTRNMSVAFNESKFVGLSMASILQALLIGVPILFLSATNPTAKYVVSCVLMFVVCTSVLVFIFVPKMLMSHGNGGTERRLSSIFGSQQSRFGSQQSRFGSQQSHFGSQQSMVSSATDVEGISQRSKLERGCSNVSKGGTHICVQCRRRTSDGSMDVNSSALKSGVANSTPSIDEGVLADIDKDSKL